MVGGKHVSGGSRGGSSGGSCGDEKGVGAEISESETRLSVSLLAVVDARPLGAPPVKAILCLSERNKNGAYHVGLTCGKLNG